MQSSIIVQSLKEFERDHFLMTADPGWAIEVE